MLAEHFLKMYSEKYDRHGQEFTQFAYDQMLNYTWRGNVRELQHAIERAVLLSKGSKIERLDIPSSAPAPVVAGAETTAAAAAPASQLAATAEPTASPSNGVSYVSTAAPYAAEIAMSLSGEDLFKEIGKLIVDRLPEPADGEQQKDVFDGLESGVVIAALKRTNGNKQAAANLLGLYRPRLYGMIKRHRLESQI